MKQERMRKAEGGKENKKTKKSFVERKNSVKILVNELHR